MVTVEIKDFTTLFEDYPRTLALIEQTKELCWMALKINAVCIEYIEEPTEEMSLYAINNLYHVPKKFCTIQTEDIKWALVKSQYSGNFGLIENPSEDMCMEAIKRDPRLIRFIENPSEDICMEAIKLDPMAIGWIKNQTDDMKIAAVSLDGSAIMSIRDQSEDLCYLAIRNPVFNSRIFNILECINQPTLEMCMEILEKNPKLIIYVKDDRLREECNRLLGLP